VTGFRIEKNGEPIVSLDDWFRLAPPKKGLNQWRDGRSAKELARRWLVGVPLEIERTLARHPDLQELRLVLGEPEQKTYFDEFRAPREHDLLVACELESGRALLAIEGKADEGFDRRVSERLATARPPTNFPERVRRLSLALFGESDPPFLGGLRYQLIQATAASVVEARRRSCALAVFLVHVLQTNATEEAVITENAADLDAFVSALTAGRINAVPAQHAVGPVSVSGYGDIGAWNRLYIAKSVADLRTT
jgi:hypothetical protein